MTSEATPAAEPSLWTRYRQGLVALAVVAVGALTAVALSRLAAEIRYDDLVAALEATPWSAVAAALVATAASFAALTVYDRQGLALAGQSLPYPIVALASFCAYAIGNVAGFGPLTGGAVRYRFYAPLGVPPEAIARVVGAVTIAFGLGLAFVGSVGVLVAHGGLALGLGLSPQALRLVAGAVLAGIAVIVGLSMAGPRTLTVFGAVIALPTARTIVVQLAATTVDVAAAGAALWVFLPAGAIDYPSFLPVYAIAIAAGVLSHVPGGLGVFETIIAAALSPRVPLESVLGALVLYRTVYYGVPLVVAALAVTGMELRRAAARTPMLGRATAGLLPLVLATLAVVNGAVFVFSGAVPATDAKLDALQQLAPLPLVEGAHFLASVVGLFLILAARGLVHRLDGAWWVAAALSALSIPLALLKGLAFGEAGLAAVLLVALLLTHRVFDRPASLVHDRLSPAWWACIGLVIAVAVGILLFVYKEVDYSHELWWQFEFGATAPRSLRAALGMALAAAAAALWLLTRAPSGRPDPADPETLAKAVAVTRAQPFGDANLVRMGDKSVMLSDDERAFIMYGKHGRSWVALFDPIGAPDAFPDLVWRFVETARRHGGRAVFYQVAATSLSLYADAGLSAFKLGEEARVRLEGFDLKGSRRASMRNAINKAEREGIAFEIVPVEGVPAILDELEAISDAWLSDHAVREKGFSLGAFERAYVAAQPVAVLKREGRILAFATLMTTDLTEEATVDLMRFRPDAPNGAMEVLFARMLLHYKEAGYRWFSLGMAPLSGLSENPLAPLWHRVGRSVFDHGEAFYNFHGLRAFKAKFDPVWTPRYMAVAGGLNPLLALADVTLLISGGVRGVVGK